VNPLRELACDYAEEEGEEAVTRRDWLMAALLVLVVVLAYTIRPKNDDAWVLWEKRMTFKDAGEATAWEPLDGFDRLADCQKSGQEILKGALGFMGSEGRKLLGVRPDGRSATYEDGESGARHTVDTRFLCFPGPFDPRSPR
jgi:hypothetical protein